MRIYSRSSQSHHPQRFALGARALLCGGMLMLAGCGGGNTSTAQTSSSPAASPNATPTSSAPPLQSRIVTVSFDSVQPNASSQTLEAACPAGYLVAGGGFNSGHTTFSVMRNAPISTTKWQGQIFNSGGEAISVELDVVCLKVSGLAGQLVTGNLGPANGGASTAPMTLSCPAGFLAAGGGFTSDHTTYTVMKNVPISATQWRGQVFNTSGGPLSAQLAVECLKASGLTSQIATVNFDAVSSGANSPVTEATCPSGYLVAGGGFSSDGAPFNIMLDEPVSLFQWDGELFNTGNADLTAQLQIVCLKH